MQMFGTRPTTSMLFPLHGLRDSPIKEWDTDLRKFKKIKTDVGLRTTHKEATPSGSYRQRHAELPLFNNNSNHFATGGLGPAIDPTRFEHVPVGAADLDHTDMFDQDQTDTSDLGQGSFDRTWADSTIPYNNDGGNSMLSVASTNAAPRSSRECSCITCVDLGSRRKVMWNVDSYYYRCRLSDCNFSAIFRSHEGNDLSTYAAEKAIRKHEKDHFRHDGRHDGQFRCIEDRCDYGAKRWPDLKRHYTSKHCLNPKTKFPCPEIGCKYGGDNGFTRKDKLKSHRDKVHGKRANTEKRSRVSKSNAQGAA